MKFKMAATAGLSLTLDPIGKMFQNASSLKPLGQSKQLRILRIRTRGENNVGIVSFHIFGV